MDSDLNLNLINIYDGLGRTIDIDTLGLIGLKLAIPSPSYRTVTEEIDGQSGVIVLERILNPRSLTAEFITKAIDYTSSLELRDEVYALLGHGRTMYVSEKKRPLRRWKVYLEEWTPERLDIQHHRFDIPLFAEAGHSETINIIKKSFKTPIFRFKNEGNILIDPRKHSETEIIFKGESTNLKIRNTTTGEEWSWNGTTSINDVIMLKGVRSLKNDVSIFKQTNKKLITLVPGWNSFEVIGATCDFELIIRSRFYFV